MSRAPLWIYVDVDRLAEAIDGERAQERPVALDGALSAVELFAVVRRSAGLHARIQPLKPAAVARMTRAELRRILGPIVEVLDDDGLRRHARRVLTADGTPAKN